MKTRSFVTLYIGDRKQRPEVDSIFKHIANVEVSNIKKDFIEDSVT